MSFESLPTLHDSREAASHLDHTAPASERRYFLRERGALKRKDPTQPGTGQMWGDAQQILSPLPPGTLSVFVTHTYTEAAHTLAVLWPGGPPDSHGRLPASGSQRQARGANTRTRPVKRQMILPNHVTGFSTVVSRAGFCCVSPTLPPSPSRASEERRDDGHRAWGVCHARASGCGRAGKGRPRCPRCPSASACPRPHPPETRWSARPKHVQFVSGPEPLARSLALPTCREIYTLVCAASDSFGRRHTFRCPEND